MENTIINIPIEDLVPDPLNDEAFNIENLDFLEENIREEGMLGTIIAYPYAENLYMIESGHRRYEAALKAGLTNVDITVTEPPKDFEERRRRLVRWNLHNRTMTPLGMAKLANFLFETYEMENKKLKKAGLPQKPILERIADDLECSKANISKYRMLLDLNKDLQSLISSGACSWAPLSAASQLSESQQDNLYKRICGKLRLENSVTGAWIENEIREYKAVKEPDRTVRLYDFDREDVSLYSKKLAENLKNRNKKRRRRDGIKTLEGMLSDITSIAKNEMFIKDEKVKTRLLGEIRMIINSILDNEEKEEIDI